MTFDVPTEPADGPGQVTSSRPIRNKAGTMLMHLAPDQEPKVRRSERRAAGWLSRLGLHLTVR